MRGFDQNGDFPLIFERSKPGRRASRPPRRDDVDVAKLLGEENLRSQPPALPEVSELDLVRHYTQLAHRQFSIDGNFYPLGSCTMKYNPKVHEDAAQLFSDLHPYQDESQVQGALELLHGLQTDLAQLTGMDEVSLQPAAGAHAELAGILIIRNYHKSRGEDEQRRIVIVPDSAHGTNPATAGMAGYEVVEVATGPDGQVDIDSYREALSPRVAAVMLTNPNTMGIFESRIDELSRLAHEAGAQLYYDGANLNAIAGRARPGDMGFDVVHLNLHKTFTTPHGGGGPGAGPVGVKSHLREFLPVPIVRKDGDGYRLDYDLENSIGRVRSFYGNFGNLVRAYAYIKTLGKEGLRDVSAKAVLNSNYMARLVEEAGYRISVDAPIMHEFIAQPPAGIKTVDIAKALLDYGVHPMTVYFPLVVREAMMIEPTETESLETLEEYAELMGKLLREAQDDPEAFREAPHSTPVRRLDEVQAARRPVLRYRPPSEG